MSLRIIPIAIFSFFLLDCGSQVLNTKDITDLLEGDGNAPANSAGNSSQNANGQSGTSSTGGSQNLNYYGLTDSPTGTTTYGSTGSPGSLDR